MRGILLFLCSAVFAGCASSPYINREVTDSEGLVGKYAYAYGKFCGPNYPRLNPGQTLMSLWPPVDQVDALCYAHDYCYTIVGIDHHYCDHAMVDAATKLRTGDLPPGCWSLLLEMWSAFFAKPYRKTTAPSDEFADKGTALLVGIPGALLVQIVASPLTLFVPPAVEGSCSSAKDGSLESALRIFEEEFATTIVNYRNNAISIPSPLNIGVEP